MNSEGTEAALDPPPRERRKILRLIEYLLLAAVFPLVGLSLLIPLPPPVTETTTFTESVRRSDCDRRHCYFETDTHLDLHVPRTRRIRERLQLLHPGDVVTVEVYATALEEDVVFLSRGEQVIIGRQESLVRAWLFAVLGAALIAGYLYVASVLGVRGTYIHRPLARGPTVRAIEGGGRRAGLAFIALGMLLFIAAVLLLPYNLLPHTQPGESRGLLFLTSALTLAVSSASVAMGMPLLVYGSPVPRPTFYRKALVSVPAGVCCFLAWTAFAVLGLHFPWQ